MSQSARAVEVGIQLDRAADEYWKARQEYERALIRFDVAKERLSQVKNLAENIWGIGEWMDWTEKYPHLRYFNTQIGSAIEAVLRNYAYEQAWAFVEGGTKQYSPRMGIDSIAARLEEGGFEFRSATPKREVNAALINLGTVQKDKYGLYQAADVEQILATVKASNDAMKRAETEEKEEVPF